MIQDKIRELVQYGLLTGLVSAEDEIYTTNRLLELAKEHEIPYSMEIMGGETGTNADEIAVSRTGVPTAMVSIPLRYMHTPVEVIDTQDVAYTARLLAEYVKGVD